jgi:hypothetical protein
MAKAASVIKAIVACKDEADSRKVLDFLGKKDTAGLDKFSAPKLAKGDCFSLSKGMAMTIDKKDGKLLCVHPWGGLDCYWTADADINQNPAEPETRPAGARRPPHSYRARGGLRAPTRREGFQAAGLKGATEAEIRASKSAARSRPNAVSPFRAPPHQKGIFDASLMPISLSGVIF